MQWWGDAAWGTTSTSRDGSESEGRRRGAVCCAQIQRRTSLLPFLSTPMCSHALGTNHWAKET